MTSPTNSPSSALLQNSRYTAKSLLNLQSKNSPNSVLKHGWVQLVFGDLSLVVNVLHWKFIFFIFRFTHFICKRGILCTLLSNFCRICLKVDFWSAWVMFLKNVIKYVTKKFKFFNEKILKFH
jgi:hypothetical protein